jgi:hypothetical protein
MKEFEHPIDYALESALPRLEAWGLVNINSQVSVNRTVKYRFGDEIPTSALASEPRAHVGAHRAYHSTHPSLSGQA